MDASVSHVPWNTPALWQAANASLAGTIQRNQAALTGCCRQSREIRVLLESLFPLMAELCRQTCPACTDICCQRAWVWIDFRDLLFLHLAGIPLPNGQLLSRQGDHCRYAGPHGCVLARIQRPFVCTWYLCPAQSRRLEAQPAHKQRLATLLGQIKAHRIHMEDAFVQAVT